MLNNGIQESLKGGLKKRVTCERRIKNILHKENTLLGRLDIGYWIFKWDRGIAFSRERR